jgi:hypothetical protein
MANLSEEDIYVVKPPVGCPRSKPGTYWKLIRSLYGLKRAARLWYDLISSCLKDMGLECCPSSPCLFKGVLIEGQPPIYIGIYVDDMIYFSVSDDVEKFSKQNCLRKLVQ